MTYRVPDAYAEMIAAREGTAGQRWLDRLPALVAAYCSRWRLAIDETESVRSGHVGVVIPVVQGSELLAPKISYPYDDVRPEGAKLAAWRGRSAAMLVAEDPGDCVLLMERLNAARSLRQLPVDTAIEVIGRLWQRLHTQPVPPGMPTTNDLAAQWATTFASPGTTGSAGVERLLLDAATEVCSDLGGRPYGHAPRRSALRQRARRNTRTLARHRPQGHRGRSVPRSDRAVVEPDVRARRPPRTAHYVTGFGTSAIQATSISGGRSFPSCEADGKPRFC